MALNSIVTVSGAGGDGITNAAIRLNVQITDGSLNYLVQGVYVPPSVGQSPPYNQQTPVAISGTATSPGIPGSGSNYWIGYITVSGGVATLATATGTVSIAALLAAAPAGAIQLFQQTIPFTGSVAGYETQWAPLVFPFLASVNPN